MKTIKFSLILLAFMAFAQTTWAQLPCLPDHGLDNDVTAWCDETQTIALEAGTNWVSFNVDITLDDLKSALVAALPSTVIMVKSETQNIQYSRGRWNGTLDWDVAKMYMIVVTSSCEIAFEGSQVDPSEHPITIAGEGNATWIGYPYSESMSVTSAFAQIVLNGDLVRSAEGNSQYTRGRWNGSVTSIGPGQGFIYVSAPTAPSRTLVYPTPTRE